MRQFSTVDLVRRLADVTRAAIRSPVTITQHRKPRYVIMSIEDYERIAARTQDPRRAYSVDDMPPELRAELIAELDKALADRSSHE